MSSEELSSDREQTPFTAPKTFEWAKQGDPHYTVAPSRFHRFHHHHFIHRVSTWSTVKCVKLTITPRNLCWLKITLIIQFAQSIAFNVNILLQMTHLANNISQMSKLWILHSLITFRRLPNCLLWNYFPLHMLAYILLIVHLLGKTLSMFAGPCFPARWETSSVY